MPRATVEIGRPPDDVFAFITGLERSAQERVAEVLTAAL